MDRRRFLALAGASGVGLATGCLAGSGSTGERSDTIYVSPDGVRGNSGSTDAPYPTIQQGVGRAQPGDTVQVEPGHYYETVETTRPGSADAPITITGPPDAVLHGDPERDYSPAVEVQTSHVHLRGLTVDGLQDPDRPDEASSYADLAIHTLPSAGEYLEGLVFKPHAVGNARGPLVNLNFVRNVEVGEFRVTGPAGLDYKIGGDVGHVGEIVYVGSPPEQEFNSLDGGRGGFGPVDHTSDVHVHHIDASAGHYHIELVDVKAGCSDVTVEYCTSVGARIPTDNDNSSAVHVGGTDVTFRWNRVASAAYHAVDVGNYAAYRDVVPHPDAPDAATNNAIYGNELVGSGAKAIRYTSETSEAAQRVVCGNVVDTETEGDPARACPADLPTTGTVGHRGGDSPWAGTETA